MSTGCGVKVVDYWGNGFGMRVRIALEEKGVQYEHIEEDLINPQRSEIVLQMNPVRKSVPILIHKGRPVSDSLAILEYIEDTWKGDNFPFLLPQDPYERACARFWINFIDNKLFSSQTKFLKSKGESKEEARKELIADLKKLEEVLGDEVYFGGDKFGFLDLAFIPYSSMFYGYEAYGNFSLEDECPKLSAWVKRCIARESVSKILPDSLKMYEVHKKFYGIE
ncbi:Glutathione transferase [Bertholletia excelsa]